MIHDSCIIRVYTIMVTTNIYEYIKISFIYIINYMFRQTMWPLTGIYNTNKTLLYFICILYS
jgi:hypothetical protein